MTKYDKWIEEGKVPFSSKVIPIGKALETKQWIIPTEQVLEILRNARFFVLKTCGCRARHQRCDNPLEVCFVINDAAEKYIAKGTGRRISIEEAMDLAKS